MTMFRHKMQGTFPGGEIWVTGLHSQGDVSVADANSAWSDAVQTFWTGNYDEYVDPDVTLTRITTVSIDESTGKQITRVDDDVSLPGASDSDSLPPQVAVIFSLRTDRATRAGRGRMYLPVPAKNAAGGGELSTAFGKTAAKAGNQLLDGLEGGSLTPVIWGGAGATPFTITDGMVASVFGTHRTRRNKLPVTYITP